MDGKKLVRMASVLLDHSLKIGKGDRVLIRGHIETLPLIKELIRQAMEREASPAYEIMDEGLNCMLMKNATEENYRLTADLNLSRVKESDAVVNIFAFANDYLFSEIPNDRMALTQKMNHEFINMMVKDKRWVLLNYPTEVAAFKAKMGFDSFEEFLIGTCTVEYEKMGEFLKPLKERMDKAGKVRITAPGTDISFSIEGMVSVPCTGENNLPDGEIFTAPVLDTVNGRIRFNTPSPFKGYVFHNMEWVFENGKVVEVSSDEGADDLNEILSIDEGARRLGEFAFGLNPLIDEAMGNILFDEKINGSIHLALGNAYDGPADNGNRSVNHWDNILILREDKGGGEVFFDGELIQKDGLFVPDDLRPLNDLKSGLERND